MGREISETAKPNSRAFAPGRRRATTSPLSAQPPGYTRDTLAPPPEAPAPEAISAMAPSGTTAKTTIPCPELPIAFRCSKATPEPPLATGSGSAKRRVTTPVRPHKEPPRKCSKNLHSVSITDVALPCATFITHQPGVYRFRHNEDIWGFACNPPQSEGMRLLNLFGDWSDSTRRNLEDFHAAFVIHLQRVSEYRVSHEAIRKGVRTPPPLPQFVVSALCEDCSWTAESAPAQTKLRRLPQSSGTRKGSLPVSTTTS